MNWWVYKGLDINKGELIDGYEYPIDGFTINSELSPGEDYEKIVDPELNFELNGDHYIRELADKATIKKHHSRIDYKSELLTGVSLKPRFELTNDGLLSWYEYTNNNKPVLRIIYEYVYNQVELDNPNVPLSTVDVQQKKKIWCYYFPDGTIDTIDDDFNLEGENRISSKEKIKFYQTLQETLSIGEKRRKNVQIVSSQNIGTALIILGPLVGVNITTPDEANEIMKHVSSVHSNEFSEFMQYGTQDIFEGIENDTEFVWFNQKILDDSDLINLVAATIITETQRAQINGAFQLYGLSHMQGMTFKEYLILKLKGEIK